MSRPIRMTVTLQLHSDPELYAEMQTLGPYYNAKRLIALARLGLMASRGLAPAASAPLPAAALELPASRPSPAATDSGGSIYEPDLTSLFADFPSG